MQRLQHEHIIQYIDVKEGKEEEGKEEEGKEEEKKEEGKEEDEEFSALELGTGSEADSNNGYRCYAVRWPLRCSTGVSQAGSFFSLNPSRALS